MLRCTEAAAAALAEFRVRHDVPPSYGLRVSATPSASGRPGIRMAFTDGPRDGDEVTEQHGQCLFVAHDVIAHVADRELDADPNLSGAGVVLRPAQSSSTGRPGA